MLRGLPLLLVSACSGPPGAPDALDLIALAGNAPTEEDRWAYLLELDAIVDQDHTLRPDLDLLLPVVDRWANAPDFWEPGDQEMSGEGGYLAGDWALRVWPDGVGEAYPPELRRPELEPLWCMYRGRMLIWTTIENGLLQDQAYADGRSCLMESQEAFPDNPVIGMYLDEPLVWSEAAPQPQAPQWAQDQRVVLHKLDEILSFWLTERQASDGQLGGGWGDDVEVWRRFTPLLFGFDHPDGRAGFELLAEGLWALPRLDGGYTDIATDVEHSAEDTGDTLTSMLLLNPTDPVWTERADALIALSETLWMGESDRLLPMYTSTQLTSSGAATGPALACDTAYHARLTQPLLQRWQMDPSAERSTFFSGWMSSWVASTAGEEAGKPAGVLPNALSWPEGTAGGASGDWLDPGCALNRGAYAYPRALSGLMRTLVFTAHASGDASLLAPIESMAAHRREALQSGVGAEGSATWAASEASGSLADALAKHRLLTGDSSYDDLLLEDGDAATVARVLGDPAQVHASLARTRQGLAFDREAFTSEVRFTDRIVKFHSKYASRTADVAGLDLTTVYAVLTGDLGDPLYVAQPAVRWRTEPTDFAAQVLTSSPTELTAELYAFGDADRSLHVEMLRPSSGSWEVSVDGQVLAQGEVAGGEFALTVPTGTLVELIVRGP